MAITIKVTGKKEAYVTRRFDVTKALVKCIEPKTTNIHEKNVTIDGKIDESDLLMFLYIEKDRFLAIHSKDDNGKPITFIGQPIEIVSVTYGKEAYKISAENFRKYGVKVSEAEAAEAEAAEAEVEK